MNALRERIEQAQGRFEGCLALEAAVLLEAARWTTLGMPMAGALRLGRALRTLRLPLNERLAGGGCDAISGKLTSAPP